MQNCTVHKLQPRLEMGVPRWVEGAEIAARNEQHSETQLGLVSRALLLVIFHYRHEDEHYLFKLSLCTCQNQHRLQHRAQQRFRRSQHGTVNKLGPDFVCTLLW